MTEISAPPPPALSFDELQRLTASTASYTRFPYDVAEGILRSGLVEETLECIYGDKAVDASKPYEVSEGPLADPEAIAARAGEIGDMWYYISEVSRRHHVAGREIVGDALDLDAFQAQQDYDLLPIQSPNGPVLGIEDDHRAVLAIAALRVVDCMNPRTDELWHGLEGRPTLGRALADLARVTAYMATYHGIGLSDAVRQTMTKLAERSRQPAVVDEASERVAMSSARRRLAVVPWVALLVAQASTTQWRPVAKPYEGYPE